MIEQLLALCLVLGMEKNMAKAIIEQESTNRVEAYNVNGRNEKIQFTSIEQSIKEAESYLKDGYTVDVGLMAINSENIRKMGLTLADAFDPCVNIETGEKIYTDNLKAAQAKGLTGDEAKRAALSMYNTGNMKWGIKNGYVGHVWKRYDKIRGKDTGKGRAVDQSNLAARMSPLTPPNIMNDLAELMKN